MTNPELDIHLLQDRLASIEGRGRFAGIRATARDGSIEDVLLYMALCKRNSTCQSDSDIEEKWESLAEKDHGLIQILEDVVGEQGLVEISNNDELANWYEKVTPSRNSYTIAERIRTCEHDICSIFTESGSLSHVHLESSAGMTIGQVVKERIEDIVKSSMHRLQERAEKTAFERDIDENARLHENEINKKRNNNNPFSLPDRADQIKASEIAEQGELEC